MFTEFTKEWNFDQNTSLPRNPRSNGQAEATLKIVKGLLSKAKYPGQDPHLALLAYRSTPIDPHLRSPAEMLYQRNNCTTLPQRTPMLQMTMTDSTNVLPRVLNTMTITAEPSPHCMQGKLSVLNNDKSLWLPAKIIWKAEDGSYLVQVTDGGQYRHAHDHICECRPDAVKPGTSTTADVAQATPESLLQAPPAKPPAAPAATVALATPQQAASAATANTPCKPPPAVNKPQQQQMPSTGGTPKQTGTAPVAPHRSARVSKPTSRLIEEM